MSAADWSMSSSTDAPLTARVFLLRLAPSLTLIVHHIAPQSGKCSKGGIVYPGSCHGLCHIKRYPRRILEGSLGCVWFFSFACFGGVTVGGWHQVFWKLQVETQSVFEGCVTLFVYSCWLDLEVLESWMGSFLLTEAQNPRMPPQQLRDATGFHNAPSGAPPL